VIEFLLQVLGNEESDKVQALICTGFAKLMLSGMISDERVCALSMIFLSTQTSDGPAGVGQLGIDLSLA
jgi:condensin complex subunit 3